MLSVALSEMPALTYGHDPILFLFAMSRRDVTWTPLTPGFAPDSGDLPVIPSGILGSLMLVSCIVDRVRVMTDWRVRGCETSVSQPFWRTRIYMVWLRLCPVLSWCGGRDSFHDDLRIPFDLGRHRTGRGLPDGAGVSGLCFV